MAGECGARRAHLQKFAPTLLALAIVVFTTAGWASSVVAQERSSEVVCSAAAELNAQQLPRRATAMIRAARISASNLCANELGQAADQVLGAIASAREAEELLDAEKWDDARVAAATALALDRDNTQAQVAQRSATAGAIASQTRPQQWLAAYRTWSAANLEPIGSLLVPVSIVLAVLLLAARVLTTMVDVWPRLGIRPRQLVLLAGLALSLVAAVRVAFVVPTGPDDLPLIAVVALLGIVLTAWALATRLRISVEVSGASGTVDTAATAHVIALLNELGGEAPKGLEVPRAADMQELTGTLKMLPESPVTKALSGSADLLFGLTPWQVLVDVKSEDLISVQIDRNGRSAGSAVIDRDQLQLRIPLSRSAPTPNSPAAGGAAASPAYPDLHRLAAAVVLVTLAGKHSGFEALCGATDWRGLGLHYVATVDLDGHSAAKQVLARAVEHDPDNLAAQVAWRYAIFREATETAELAAYIDWLGRALRAVTDTKGGSPSPQEGYGALRQRMLYSRAAATVNYFYANGGTFGFDARGARWKPAEVRAVFAELLTELEDTPKALVTLRQAARPGAAAMAGWVNDVLPIGHRIDSPNLPKWLWRPAGPNGHYNVGCFYATRNDPSHDLAVRHLQLATDLPRLRDWMKNDPQLRSVFDSVDTYRKHFNRLPSTDVLSLPTLQPFGDQLKAAGVADLWSLRRYLAAPSALHHVVGSDLTITRQILATIRVAASVPADLSPFRVELCREIIERDQLDLVRNLSAGRGAGLAGEITRSIRKQCTSAPERAAVTRWLRSLSS
jgi:hypothetical protein